MAEYAQSHAEERYEALAIRRQPYLDEARECSELTIPRLIPKDGRVDGELPATAQDDGARNVNGLANSIVLANVPPNQPVMRFETAEVVEAVMNSQSEDPETKEKMDRSSREVRKHLDRVARETLKITAVKGHRAVFYEGKKHLVCGGNILYWAHDDKKNYGKIRAVPLSRYVCLRDSLGFPIEVVIRDGLSAANLPPNLKEILNDSRTPLEVLRDEAEVRMDSPDTSNLALYTYACWDPEKSKYKFHQCFRGNVVPDSEALYSEDDFPLLPLTFSRGDGEDYGRGHVEESRGVLMALEALSQAETTTSIALSEFRLLVGSGSSLRALDILSSPIGSPIDAEPGSITALSYGKAGDLASIQASIAMKQRQLGIKFGDSIALQRNAERVTAEEFRTLTMALERTLGGTSAGISATFLPWYARVLLRILKREIGLAASDVIDAEKDGAIQLRLITGLDALGRNFEAQQFFEAQRVVSELTGAETYGKKVVFDSLADKVNGYYGIETKGLYKTEEQLAAEAAREQQAQQNLAVAPSIVDAYKEAALRGNEGQK